MSVLETILPQTSKGWNQAAYYSFAIGSFILLLSYVSGQISGSSFLGAIFKLVVFIAMVVLFFYCKARSNKLRGLN